MRFRKSIKLFPGVRINLSGSGISTSVGVKGATINIKPGRKTRATVGDDLVDVLRSTIKGALPSPGYFGVPPLMQQCAQVESALLVNGPGEGKLASILSTDGVYEYERIQQPKATYMITRFGIPAMSNRQSTGVHVYRIGYVAELPANGVIRRLIADAKFQPYKFDKREPRN